MLSQSLFKFLCKYIYIKKNYEHYRQDQSVPSSILTPNQPKQPKFRKMRLSWT